MVELRAAAVAIYTKAEGSSIVDEPGEGWTPVRENDHGHFSSYEGHKERRTGKIRGRFSRMHRALDGWMLVSAPASPAQGFHHHGPRYFIFSYFCTMRGLVVVAVVVSHIQRIGCQPEKNYFTRWPIPLVVC